MIGVICGPGASVYQQNAGELGAAICYARKTLGSIDYNPLFEAAEAWEDSNKRFTAECAAEDRIETCRQNIFAIERKRKEQKV